MKAVNEKQLEEKLREHDHDPLKLGVRVTNTSVIQTCICFHSMSNILSDVSFVKTAIAQVRDWISGLCV